MISFGAITIIGNCSEKVRGFIKTFRTNSKVRGTIFAFGILARNTVIGIRVI
jgi:hypothetical protein